jgi:murein DD-endopeptidase MepM/ murein hydrolase activator NlpD
VGYYLIMLLGFLGASCSSQGRAPKSVVNDSSVKAKELKIVPGGVIKLSVENEWSHLTCEGEKLTLVRGDKEFFTFFVESYFSNLKTKTCFFEDGQQVAFTISVEEVKYKEEKLSVQPSKINPPKKDLARIQKEQTILNKLYKESASHPYFLDGFIRPMSLHISSQYGTKRMYNNEKAGQHLGVDFASPVNTPVFASNGGKVVLARDLFYTGLTVIIDHGMGIFTVYGHLDSLRVEENTFVQKNQSIALSGKTGRVTGPHLHWGVKIRGEWVNGLLLIEETKNHTFQSDAVASIK